MKKSLVAVRTVVASMALLLVPAVPAHATAAGERAAMRDANELAGGLEVYFVTEGHWPKHINAAVLDQMGVTLAKGNVVRRYKAGVPMQHAGGDIYRFCIVNTSTGGWSNYESYDDGITAHSPNGSRCTFPK